MNIILLTILLTLLGTGLVVLLVWLSVVSWKSVKYKKKSKKKISALGRNAEEHVNNIYIYIDEYKKQMRTEVDDIYNQMLIRSSEINERVDKLNIDSRLDKLHNLIKENKENKENKNK
jgi:gas vesicle protein